MSSREPMWYCYECHAEMRPLMVPDPHCASCNGTFVEKIENTADDPRNFQTALDGTEDDPFAPEGFIFGLQNLLRTPGSPGPRSTSPRPPGASGRPDRPPFGGGTGFTIHIDRTSGNGGQPRAVNITRSNGSGDVPLLSEFVSRRGRGDQQGRDSITGQLMIHYLLAMLAQRPGADGQARGGPGGGLFEALLGGGAETGRWGDYVFNQEALDQIITQLMENSSSQPVPAPDEVIEKLPKEVLEEESPLLGKDCAVCKEQFKLGTEDPDEQVVIMLPCKHPFHQTCILPWLKSSGTCPVCRYQLVPQPGHQAAGSSTSSGSSPSSRARSVSPRRNGSNSSPGNGGILSNIFNYISGDSSRGNRSSSGGDGSPSHSNGQPSSPQNRRSTDRNSSDRNRNERDLPGGWGGELD